MGGQGTGDGSPRLARVAQQAELPAALDRWVCRDRVRSSDGRRAGGMDEAARQTLAVVLRDAVVPSVQRPARSSSTAAPTPG